MNKTQTTHFLLKMCFLFSLGFFFCPSTASAQYYLVGQDPASTKWKQINTDHFQVVFPQGFDDKAQEVARMLEFSIDKVAKAYDVEPKKLSLIMHNRTMTSNGFVSWAPSRSEFYTTPHQDVYAQDWLEQLVVHELRHVVQMNKVEQEMPQILRILFGEQAAPAITGLYLPFWFLEGDAVITETAKSHVGRGRVPTFGMEMRAQLYEKGIYTYDKEYLGSYKDYVPNFYNMGYHFMTGVQREFGDDIWQKVVNHVSNRPFSGMALNRALKKNTGYNKVPLYNKVFEQFREEWRKEIETAYVSPIKRITKDQKIYTQYRYAHRFSGSSSVVALRYGYDDIPAFVKIDSDGEETVLYEPGSWSSESVAYGDNSILWVESMNNARWTFLETSRLYILNLDSKTPKKINMEGRYFAPSVSPDGSQVVLVSIAEDYTFSFAFLDVETGAFVKSVAIPNKAFPQTPYWAKDGSIYYVSGGRKGKSIVQYNPARNTFKELLAPSYNQLRRPVVKEKQLYYVSSQGGKDDLWKKDLTTGQERCIGVSQFGFRDVCVAENDDILLSNYTADGFELVQLEEKHNASLYQETEEERYPLAEMVAEIDPGVIEFSEMDSTTVYEVDKYSKFKNLLRVHSWAPVGINIDDEQVKPGVSFFSQNNLSTMTAQAGYEYDIPDNTGRWFGNVSYFGWYPVIEFEMDYQKYKQNYYTTNGIDSVLTSTHLKQTGAELSVSLPQNYSVGKWYRNFTPKVTANWTHVGHSSDTPSDLFFEGNIMSLQGQLYFSNLKQAALRDVHTRWGQILNIEYIQSVGGDRDYGNAAGLEGYFYTPGLFRHHGIRWYAGYQTKKLEENLFGDIVNRASGVGSITNEAMFTVSGKYSLPLCYPDWSLGGLIYFQRITTSLFYDYSRVDALFLGNENQLLVMPLDIHSYGGELKTNCNFLRFNVPAQLGARFIYLPDFNDFRTELIFSVSFSSL